MRLPGLGALIVVMSIVPGTSPGRAEVPSSAPCRRVGVAAHEPVLATSAAWNGPNLLLPLPRTGELLVLQLPSKGSPDRATFRSVRIAAAPTPFEVRESGGSLWLLAMAPDQTMVLFSLDGTLAATPVHALTKLALAGEMVLMGALDVLPVGSDLYGTVFTLKGQRRSFEGLGVIRFDPTPALLPLLPLAIGDPGRGLTETYPAIFASVGARVYALVNASPPRIEEVAPRRRPLNAFPPAYRHLPTAPNDLVAQDAAWEFARRTAAAAMVTGLFGGERYLYLLARAPAGEASRFSLFRIDPTTDVLEGPLQLPSSSSELVVAPGKRQWAFVEQGPMEGDLTRTLSSVVLIPTAVLEGEWPNGSQAFAPCLALAAPR